MAQAQSEEEGDVPEAPAEEEDAIHGPVPIVTHNGPDAEGESGVSSVTFSNAGVSRTSDHSPADNSQLVHSHPNGYNRRGESNQRSGL